MPKYSIVINRPGYLPEADPIEIEIIEGMGAEAEQVLKVMQDEVEWRWQAADTNDVEDTLWENVIDEIYNDHEHAADFDPRGGFLYHLPGGYVIEATFIKE